MNSVFEVYKFAGDDGRWCVWFRGKYRLCWSNKYLLTRNATPSDDELGWNVQIGVSVGLRVVCMEGVVNLNFMFDHLIRGT